MVTLGLMIYKLKLSKGDFLKTIFFVSVGIKPDKLEFYYF